MILSLWAFNLCFVATKPWESKKKTRKKILSHMLYTGNFYLAKREQWLNAEFCFCCCVLSTIMCLKKCYNEWYLCCSYYDIFAVVPKKEDAQLKHGMWKIGLKTIRCYYESKLVQCLFSVKFWNLPSFFFFFFKFYWRVGMVPQGGSGLNLMDASDDLLDLMTKPLGAIDYLIFGCVCKRWRSTLQSLGKS